MLKLHKTKQQQLQCFYLKKHILKNLQFGEELKNRKKHKLHTSLIYQSEYRMLSILHNSLCSPDPRQIQLCDHTNVQSHSWIYLP